MTIPKGVSSPGYGKGTLP